MVEVIAIQHDKITRKLLDEIIRVKSVAWPYSYEEQCSWIKTNLKHSDIHLLLTRNKEPVAYLNLIEIVLKINNEDHNGLGIGNVCTIERGKGCGMALMMHANQFIIQHNKVGLLFCKPDLAEFYKKCGWTIIHGPQLNNELNNKNIQSMVFNYNLPVNQLTFLGKAF